MITSTLVRGLSQVSDLIVSSLGVNTEATRRNSEEGRRHVVLLCDLRHRVAVARGG